MSRKDSGNSGSVILFILVIVAAGAAINFLKENLFAVAAIGIAIGVYIVVSLITRIRRKKKSAQEEALRQQEHTLQMRKIKEEADQRERESEKKREEWEKQVELKKAAMTPRLVENRVVIHRVDQCFLNNPPSEYVAFDLETTGLRAESEAIIEIGAVSVKDGEIVSEYQQLVKPPFLIPDEATAVNHITNMMVERAPSIQEVLPQFLEFLGKTKELVAHNAKFDAEFLTTAADRQGIKMNQKYYDTLAISQKFWPNLYNKKLDTVAEHIGHQIDGAHRALADAKAVHAIMQAAINKIPEMKIEMDVESHFKYLDMINDRYRSANQKEDPFSPAMDEVIALCKQDIALADSVYTHFINEGLGTEDRPMVNYSSFQRLAIIYEKRGMYEEAIGVCEQAINKGFPDDGTKGGMAARIDKMNKHITRRDSQKEKE